MYRIRLEELNLDELNTEYIEQNCNVKIFADDEFGLDWCNFARRPYYRLRGKPVSPEQAVEIIARTDSFLTYVSSLTAV